MNIHTINDKIIIDGKITFDDVESMETLAALKGYKDFVVDVSDYEPHVMVFGWVRNMISTGKKVFVIFSKGFLADKLYGIPAVQI